MMSGGSQPVELLRPDSLAGVRIALSASESPDLARLGLMDTHFHLAMAEVTRSVLVAGGKLAYGGHLRPDGFTTYLVKELHRYSRQQREMRLCLAWTEHRTVEPATLKERTEDLGLFGEIVCLDPDGKPVAAQQGETIATFAADAAEQALTGMRRYVANQCQGLMVLGGKRTGFQGQLPGVIEEVLLFLEQGKPVYPAGGFGGTALEVVKAVCGPAAAWLPDAVGSVSDPRLADGIQRLGLAVAGRGWDALSNGLKPEENLRLAATNRPSEIAALISLGLGRRFTST